jgi:hypothetical protein
MVYDNNLRLWCTDTLCVAVATDMRDRESVTFPQHVLTVCNGYLCVYVRVCDPRTDDLCKYVCMYMLCFCTIACFRHVHTCNIFACLQI